MVSEGAQRLIELMRSRPAAPAGISVAEQRAGFESMAQPVAADVAVTRLDANGVPAEWIAAPGADSSRAILYLHGGGYVIGSIATHREMLGRLSRAAGVRVLAIDYRLAPEHPFPAAVEDAVAAYRWLLAQGIDAQSIAIGGDSAGGGLTAATLVSLRDQGIAQPAVGVMLSPWTDLAGTGESLRTRAAIDPIITGGGSGISSMATNYAAGRDLKTPLISPLYADLKGLPPLLIQVGTSEVLFDDSTRFDAAARGAGVDVTFEAWNGMVHVWHLFAGMVPEGQEAIERIGQFVKARTRGLAPA